MLYVLYVLLQSIATPMFAATTIVVMILYVIAVAARNVTFDVNDYLIYRQDVKERKRLEKTHPNVPNIQASMICPARDLAQCNQSSECCLLCTIDQATLIIRIEPEPGFLIITIDMPTGINK